MARKQKNAETSGSGKKDVKTILTQPITLGGKKKEHTEVWEEEEATGKGKKAKSSKSRQGKKGKKGATTEPKELTTYDAIKHQKLKLRQQEDIKAFFTRAVVMVLIAVALFSLLFGFYSQRDNGMAPKLASGDLLLYYRLDNDFKTQDLVVYEKNGKINCGRVVAKEGDSVDIKEDGGLVVNGSQMIETEIYYTTFRREDGAISYPLTLSVNQVFVLGDYRDGAIDSRSFGPVNKAEIKGKVITVLRRSNL